MSPAHEPTAGAPRHAHSPVDSAQPGATGAGAHTPPPTQAEARAEHQSLGEMFTGLSEKLSTLVRQEVALAKAEAKDSAVKGGKGAGMLAGAAVAAHFLLLFLSLALMHLLDAVMPLACAALTVAVLWGAAAAVLAAMGKKNLENVKGLPQTQETVQEIPDTLNPAKETR